MEKERMRKIKYEMRVSEKESERERVCERAREKERSREKEGVYERQKRARE